jgi:hypothetical protein
VVLFALFVIATGGAFFVTQRLKRSDPIVSRVFFQPWIGPACRCDKSHVTLRFDLPKAQRVTVSLVNREGEVVKTFADDVFLSKGTHPYRWDGRDDDGVIVPDGSYRMRVGLREEGRSVTAPRVLRVDTRAPRPKIVAVTPPTVVPGSASRRGRVRIRFVGPSNPPAEISVWRTDAGPRPIKVATLSGHRGRQTATWDGLVNGRPAPEGAYAFSVTVQDKAGNKGSVPRRLPPVKRQAVARGGVSVAYFTLQGPLVPVRPGAIARFTVGPVPRATRWRLATYGRGGTLRSGISHGSTIAVRIPRDADSDIYSVSATAGERRATWPLVVSNPRGAAPVLVVLPAMTWQGQNAEESNRDGWPDTLDAGDDVPLARPFLRGRPPQSIVTQSVATLEYLAHIRANYDLTTDVALAAGKTPAIEGHNGVLYAGTQRWITPKLFLQLRRFVTGGGTAVSLGEDALRRGVDLQNGMLVDPSRRRRADVFGERASSFTSPDAPLVLSQDKLAIFGGSDGYIGSFTRFERSDALDPKAALLTAGSRPPLPNEADKPDFVAYTLGKGLVIRTGTDQWAAALADSPEVGNAMRRMWTLLSR